MDSVIFEPKRGGRRAGFGVVLSFGFLKEVSSSEDVV